MKPLVLKVEDSKIIKISSSIPSPNITSFSAKNCYSSQNYFQTIGDNLRDDILRSRSCSGSIEMVSPPRPSSYDRRSSTSTQNSSFNTEQSPQFKSTRHSSRHSQLDEKNKQNSVSEQLKKPTDLFFNKSPTKNLKDIVNENNFDDNRLEITEKTLPVKRRAPSRNLL